MSYKVICAFGDSITNGYWDDEGKGGWFGRLQQHIAPAYPYKFGFNNLAQDGDRSFDVMHRIQSELAARTPDFVILAVGINDLIRWHSVDTPLEMSDTLIDEIWDKIFARLKPFNVRVMVQAVLPVAESRFPNDGGAGRKLYHLNADVERYNTRLKAAAAAAGHPFFDIYTPAQAAGWIDHVYDGGHPNARGHQFIADHVFAELKRQGWLN